VKSEKAAADMKVAAEKDAGETAVKAAGEADEAASLPGSWPKVSNIPSAENHVRHFCHNVRETPVGDEVSILKAELAETKRQMQELQSQLLKTKANFVTEEEIAKVSEAAGTALAAGKDSSIETKQLVEAATEAAKVSVAIGKSEEAAAAKVSAATGKGASDAAAEVQEEAEELQGRDKREEERGPPLRCQ
jgi:hypothetical protein